MKRGAYLALFLCVLVLFPFYRAFGADDENNLEERIKTLEELSNTQQKKIEEQQKTIDGLKGARDAQTAPEAQPAASPGGAVNEQAAPGQIEQQVQELKEKVNEVVEAQRKVLPSEFNPSIGLVGETIFSYRSKGSSQTGSSRPGGFDVFQRSVELNAAGSVDPFAKAYIVANASADAHTGEATLGIEEAALQTTSLPWNLELKAGRFFGEFGRLSYIHDHELPFVNRPLVLDQYIGGESRTDGLQVNWLAPIEHYVSLTAGVGDQFGGDFPNPNDPGEFRHVGGLNFWGRLSTYFDLTPDISLEPGISGLWNPTTVSRGGALLQPDGSTVTERERRLAGVDMVLSWRPLRNNQFQTVTWGTEVLYSNNRFDVTDPSGMALPGRSVGSMGMYSYLAYKFHRQWTTGFLFDYVQSAQNSKAETFAYSPYITWTLSHWDQIRLQYTCTNPNAASGLRPDNAVYVQWAWIIGSHAHGWQQR